LLFDLPFFERLAETGFHAEIGREVRGEKPKLKLKLLVKTLQRVGARTVTVVTSDIDSVTQGANFVVSEVEDDGVVTHGGVVVRVCGYQSHVSSKSSFLARLAAFLSFSHFRTFPNKVLMFMVVCGAC